MASLGFNQQRQRRQTNLPGGVANAVPSVASVRRRSPIAPTPPKPTLVLPKPAKATTPPDAPTRPEEATHWVYATVAAAAPLRDDAGREVAGAGESVLLFYPMRQDDDTGRVYMRARRADAVTGQLTDAWVVVYDKQHLVTHFRV